jgi:hypothetical protein
MSQSKGSSPTTTTKLEASLFAETTTDEVRKLTTSKKISITGQDHLDAARTLVRFNVEKAKQLRLVDEEALMHLERMSIFYEEKIVEEKSKHEKAVLEMKTKYEVSSSPSVPGFWCAVLTVGRYCHDCKS